MNPGILISMNAVAASNNLRSLGNVPDPKDLFLEVWNAASICLGVINGLTTFWFHLMPDEVTLGFLITFLVIHTLVQIIFLLLWLFKYKPLYD